MNELERALGEISQIRRQVARTTEFRGYGPATLAATGAFAFIAASAQAIWLPEPAHHIGRYLVFWLSTAAISAGLSAVQMSTRSQRVHSGMADAMIRMAVEQFLPSLVAGMLGAAVLARYAQGAAWLIPGLWQITFSLGVFASCRFLPRPMFAAGIWYLVTGLFCVSLGGDRALSPWAMGVPYGVGQLLVAAILLLSRPKAGHEA